MSPALTLFVDCYAPLISGSLTFIQSIIIYAKWKRSEEVRQRLSAKFVYILLLGSLSIIGYGLYHLPMFNH
jgi:hypothetical protein